MGLFSFIKNALYQLLVRSHALYYMLPYIKPLTLNILFLEPGKGGNHEIVDDSGQKIQVCKIDDRIYPAFSVERVKTFSKIAIRHSDVLLCGYPKTGCHWTYEILTMLVTGQAKLSKHGKGIGGMIDLLPDVIIDSIPSPRVLNTHYLYEQLPDEAKAKKVKIVYTTRNPKDTCVSFFNHVINLPLYEYHGQLDDFFKLFMSGQVEYGSYFDYTLDWDKHIKKQSPNEILLLEFEKLKAHPKETVKSIAEFLNIKITDKFAEEVVEATSFAKMKKTWSKDFTGGIFRKGNVGDWHNWLTDEQSAAIDKVWQERMLGCTYQPHYQGN